MTTVLPSGADITQSLSDSALEPFLCATAVEADSRLAALISDGVTPVVQRVVRHHMLRRGAVRQAAEEVEDIEAEAVADVLGRLRDLRNSFNADPIANLSGYVATVATNACHRWIRSKRPNRARLKNRLRYLFGHDPGLGLWPGPSGELLCGHASHRGGRLAPDLTGLLSNLAEDHAGLRAAASRTGTPSEAELSRVIVRRIKGAVPLDDLTELVATILGIADTPPEGGDDGSLVDALPAAGPSVLTTLSDRADLERLWGEVMDLPVRQRTALLLNLRDADGGGILGLFPLTGVASMRDIAAALEMPARELAELWGTLPIEDARIAERLGITRQQVINLRKSARERLARRVAR